MASNGMFRTALFGGYNKEDVEEYITNLEHEIDALKVLHQKEKNELARQIKEMKEEALDQEEKRHGAPQRGAEEEEDGMPGSGSDGIGGFVSGEEYEDLLEKNASMRERLRSAEEELRKLRENQGSDYFDYETVSRIMDEARRNAAEIEENAREKAEKMLEDAKAETESQKELVVRRINAQLEEKGIELMAAKYKIEQYAKEIDSAQQGLYNLNVRVKKMAESMPVRLDDYWQGEHYRSLERMLSAEGNGSLPENSGGKRAQEKTTEEKQPG